jgi:hypothetical protein
LCASESASRTEKPFSRSIQATALFPLAMPPVRPRRSIILPSRSSRRNCRRFRSGAAESRGFHGVAHEHGDGHGADAAGNWSESASGVDGIGMNVSDEDIALGVKFFETCRKIFQQAFGFFRIGDAVGTDVDDSGSSFYPIAFHIASFAHCRDDDIGAAYDARKVTRLGVADGDGGVGVHEEQSHGFTDDVTAAEDDSVGALDGNFGAAKNFHASRGSASDEAGAPTDEAAEIDGMETVDVLGGVDGFKNAFGVDLLGKRELDEDAVDIVVAIEIFDDAEHFESGDGGWRSEKSAGHAELFAGGDFAFYVEVRGGIVADEDGGETGFNAHGGEKRNFVLKFGEDLVTNFEAVEEACGHVKLAFVGEGK